LQDKLHDLRAWKNNVKQNYALKCKEEDELDITKSKNKTLILENRKLFIEIEKLVVEKDKNKKIINDLTIEKENLKQKLNLKQENDQENEKYKSKLKIIEENYKEKQKKTND